MDRCQVEGCSQAVPNAAHQPAERAKYAKDNLRLVELNDADIDQLDDVLPRMLLRFGIESA